MTRSGEDRKLTADQVSLLKHLSGPAPLSDKDGAAPLLRLLCMYAERQLDITLRSARVLEQLIGPAVRARSN